MPAEVFVEHERTAEDARDLQRRHEAVADADRVYLEGALGARDRAPGRIEAGRDGPLDLLAPLGPGDGVAVQQWDAGPAEVGEVADALR